MNIGVVGLGLMGGSFAKTVKTRTDFKVYGADRDSNVILKAKLTSTIDDELNMKNIKKIDLLLLAVYPRSVKATLDEYLPHLKDGAVVIDFCGIKREICTIMKEYSSKYPNINFLGGHPMAGREYSGFDHAITTLFDKSSMLLVPVKVSIFKEEELKNFFLSLGFGEVIFTTADTHDKIIAFTSELCHIVSNAFIKSPTAEEHHGYSAGSYKDLTRVARLDSSLWSALMMDNKDKLLFELKTIISHLDEYKNALENGDEERLKALLEDGNQIKLRIDKRVKK